VKGYLSTFNNIDEQGDRVKPGAFKRTLQNKYEYKKVNNTRYIMPLLWQHKETEPIGGYVDAYEDEKGLFVELELDLDVQKGREAYSALKKGYVFQQSMGYDTIKSDYVRVDGEMVRDLIEVRLWEGSIVTFPANIEAVVTNVKAASGKTSWPLADRDTKWDSGQANKDIQEYAADGDDLDWSKVAQCFFWVAKNPPEKLGDCKLPFVANVNGKMMAIPQGIISCAGVIQGAMGGADIDDLEGVKSKIATYYKKMDMTPPWESDDDDKSSRRPMNRKNKDKQKELKTVLDHYHEEQAQDLLEDWQDIFVCALTCAVLDAFKIGDQPEADVSAALDDFKELVLSKFVTQAVECNLSQYINDSGYSYSPADYAMQYGSESRPNYGYMSNSNRHSSKAGKPISAANMQKIDGHVKSIKAIAKKAKAAMQDHVNAMHDHADDMVSDLTGGNGKSLFSKAGRVISANTAQAIKDYASTMHDHADKAMDIMNEHAKALRSAADDFANTIQGSEQPYEGDDPGEADDDQQEGKGRNTVSSQKTHSTTTHSQKSTVDEEKAIEDAIDDLRRLRFSLI
jgi:HK97 family phage prohead protease